MLKLSLNQITTKDLPFQTAVDCYARANFQGITPWRENVESVGVRNARRLIQDAALEVSGFCVCGLFTRLGPVGRPDVLNDARRAIDMAAELGAKIVVTVVGGLFPGDRNTADGRKFIFDCLQEIRPYAVESGVTLGIEPLHPMNAAEWSLLTTLRQANDWAEALGEGVGVIVDTYHTWWDAHLGGEITRAGRKNNLVTFHVADWLVPTTDLMNDRGLPGDGIIDMIGITRQMVAAGYSGWLETEIFSTRLWQGDQEALPGIIYDRVQTLLSALGAQSGQ